MQGTLTPTAAFTADPNRLISCPAGTSANDVLLRRIQKSIDRHLLFRGISKTDFRLVESDYSYMDTSIAMQPYIPVTVAGEKLPIVVKNANLLQWQADRKRFATCETIAYGKEAGKQRAAFPVLAELCPKAPEIYDWAANQLPHKNGIPNWRPPT